MRRDVQEDGATTEEKKLAHPARDSRAHAVQTGAWRNGCASLRRNTSRSRMSRRHRNRPSAREVAYLGCSLDVERRAKSRTHSQCLAVLLTRLNMATQRATSNVDIRHAFARPITRGLSDIKLVSHSNVFYRWRAWVLVLRWRWSVISGPRRCDRARACPARSSQQQSWYLLYRGSHFARRFQTSRHLLGPDPCHDCLLCRSIRMVWLVGRHSALCPPPLRARKHGLLPPALRNAPHCLAAWLFRLRSIDRLARPARANGRGTPHRWPGAQL